MRSSIRITLYVFSAIIVILLLMPQAVYLYYISGVDKPQPPQETAIPGEDAVNLWEKYENSRTVSVEKTGPYKFIYSLYNLTHEKRETENFLPSGSNIASIIAKDFLLKYHGHTGILTWHLNNAALSIWISKNWTAEQMLAKVMEMEKSEVNVSNDVLKIVRFLNFDKRKEINCNHFFVDKTRFFCKFAKDYKANDLGSIYNDFLTLSDIRNISILSGEINNVDPEKRDQHAIFKEKYGTFFELYTKTLLTSREQMKLSETPLETSEDIRKAMYEECKKYNNCDMVDELYKKKEVE